MACNGEGKLAEKFFMQLDGEPERYNKNVRASQTGLIGE
jgi:hypothetical protein